MNADEFLALVERYPLPWRASGDAYERVCYDTADSTPLYGDAADALADAAPALAAAVIRYLRAVEAQNAHVNGPMQGISPEDWSAQNFRLYETTDAAFTALRAALPEAMRP